MIKLSIIIVTYNSKKLIIDCLDSIYAHNDIGEELEVIVVDNDSPEQEEMFSLIRERFKDNVALLNSKRNGGYGYGNNLGITHSNADIVIVMNPDVRLVKPIFKGIVDKFSDLRLGLLGVNFVDGSCPYYFKRGCATLFRSLFLHYYIWRGKYNPNEMYMSGSFLAFKKEAFQKAGCFDEKIFMYSEEADITNRLLQSGYTVTWCKDIKVLHLAHGRSFNPYLNQVRMESGRYYEQKYNIDSERVYRTTRRAYRIIIFIARLLGKNDKVTNYSMMLDAEERFYQENVAKTESPS